MHSLNQSSEDQRQWCEYQRTELGKLGVSDLKIAFPGSLLCNQILVPANNEISVDDIGFSLPDVSHVVYEYCDKSCRSMSLENSLILDVDGVIDHDSVASIVAERLKELFVSRVVLLGRSAYQRYGEAIHSKLSQGIEVQMFEPDWMSSSAMHSVYRQASAVLFINSMRVLDAVGTGCEGCSLVAGREFRQEISYPVLQSYLESMCCVIYNESGVLDTTTGSRTKLPYFLVENSVQTVKEALGRNNADRDLTCLTEEDWFVSLNTESSVPVIKPYRSIGDKALTGLRDRKTGVARKMFKLRDDPGAFLLDSKFRLLRILGRAVQDKTAGI